MSFVFYDTETTGLKKGFDQIVQFAAILTDADLNELDRFDLRCRIQPHVIPHPKAMLSNRLSIERLTDPALPSHYEMVCDLRWRLGQWGKAIYVGYNSIRFDEEMLRHALFQSLFPAYLTSTPGCGRADAMHIVLAACADATPCLTLAAGENGRPTFRLEAVAAANGIDLGPAHDALTDAETTLALCRRVADGAPEIWSRFIRTANKTAVNDLVESEPVFVLTEFFGFQPTHRHVTCVARETGNPNGRLCWDLGVDPVEAASHSEDALIDLVARPDGPLRRLRINAGPAIAMTWDAPPAWNPGEVGEADQRADWLRENSDFGTRLAAIQAAHWASRDPSPHVELQLYDGFPDDADQALMADFHKVGKADRRRLIDHFTDSRVQVFSRRLLHAEYRSAFSEADRHDADRDLAERLLVDRGGPLTLPAALASARENLLANGDVQELMSGYEVWLEARIAKVQRYLAEPV